jgi:hypothetical protein
MKFCTRAIKIQNESLLYYVLQGLLSLFLSLSYHKFIVWQYLMPSLFLGPENNKYYICAKIFSGN